MRPNPVDRSSVCHPPRLRQIVAWANGPKDGYFLHHGPMVDASPGVPVEVRKSALVVHSAAQMFDLIEAAENYPSFLPWCAGATILARDDSLVAAEILVDYHGARFSFTTRNPKRRPEWMAITLQRGPFRHFEGEWHIRALSPSACKIEFMLRYEFGGLLGVIAAPVFDRIANTLVDAFVVRAERTFGSTATGDTP
jgi:ribosome-associated toxin RatA of RatAB toxin-antitoxin module